MSTPTPMTAAQARAELDRLQVAEGAASAALAALHAAATDEEKADACDRVADVEEATAEHWNAVADSLCLPDGVRAQVPDDHARALLIAAAVNSVSYHRSVARERRSHARWLRREVQKAAERAAEVPA